MAQVQAENPFLLALAKVIHFLLSLISLVSLVLLIIGFVISMSNVMTNGQIVDSASMRNVWAIATSLAIEANIPLMFYHAWQAWTRGNSAEGWCSFLLGLALACVTGMSVGIESLQQSLNIPLTDAIARMHIDLAMLVYFRVGLIILLVIREGYRLFMLLENAPEREQKKEPQKRHFRIPVSFHPLRWFLSFLRWVFSVQNEPQKNVIHPSIPSPETPVNVPSHEPLSDRHTDPLMEPVMIRQQNIIEAVIPDTNDAVNTPVIDDEKSHVTAPISSVNTEDNNESSHKDTSRSTVTIEDAAKQLNVSVKQVKIWRTKGMLKTATRNRDLITLKSIHTLLEHRQRQQQKPMQDIEHKAMNNGNHNGHSHPVEMSELVPLNV